MRFRCEVLNNGCAVISALNVINERVELFYVSDAQEAAEVTRKLNAVVEELEGEHEVTQSFCL